MLYKTTYLRWLCVPMVIMATLAAGVALSACTDRYNRSADEIFASAEELMEEHPDSSMALLEAIDPDRLSGARRHALYALLLTQARDKNYIDETSDSLISIATAYFDNSRDTYRRMLAHYYLSRVNYYGGNYVEAAREAEAALTALPGDHQNTGYWKGRLNFDLAKLAYITSNYIDACKYGQEASNLFDSISENDWKIEANFITVRSLMALQDWDLSFELLESIDTLAIPINIYPEYLYLKMWRLMHAESWNDAKILYLNAIKTNPLYEWKCDDEARIGYIYARLGDYENADKYLKNASDMASCHNDTLNVSYYTALVHLLKNNDIDSFNKINLFLQHSYEESAKRIDNHIAIGATAYYKYHAENESLKNKLYIAYIFLLISILIIIVTSTILFIIRFRRNKIYEVNTLTLINRSLRASISDLHFRENTIIKKYDEVISNLKSALSTSFGKINQLSKKKFANEKIYTNRISRELIGIPDEISFLNDFSKIISELNSPTVFHTLESSINHTEGNLMQHFRNDFPRMSDQELKLAILIFSDIGSHTICLILNIPNLEALRNRKSRLKRHIEKSESQYKDAYLIKF